LAKTVAMLLLLTPKNSVKYMSWKKSLCELCANHFLSPVLNNIQTSGNILNTRFSVGQGECRETCFLGYDIFLFLNFRRVLIVICCLLGKSPASM
jgi:putative component of toxin-antitoxin plasmid stabilization module